MTDPTPTDAQLDQAVIDAGSALIDLLINSPDDVQAIADATRALHDAEAARGYV